MTKNLDPKKIHLRTGLILQEGIRRGMEIEPVSYKEAFFKVGTKNKGFKFQIYPGFQTLMKRQEFADAGSKEVKKKFLAAANLPYPKTHGIFQKSSELVGREFWYPLVAKRLRGHISRNVFTKIQNFEELMAAAKKIEADGDEILIEEMIEGLDYRVLCVAGKYVGAVERRAANVVGDGRRSIKELIDRKNQEPWRGEADNKGVTVHKLVFDEVSKKILQKEKLTLSSVLPTGKMLKVQKKIAAVLGSDYVDATDKLHSSIVKACEQFSRRFNMILVGFDLITPDPALSLNSGKSIFNEFNTQPNIDLNENNNMGQKRPVSGYFWDYLEKNKDKVFTPDFQEF